MKRPKRREFEVFSLSFMDCICCGFGAIILLFVLIQGRAPIIAEQRSEDLTELLEERENQLFEIRGETVIYQRQLTSLQEQLSENKEKLARLQGDLSRIRGQFAATRNEAIQQEETIAELEQALQEVPEPFQRQDPADEKVGGVPVDSEWIAFVVDTSGSMRSEERYVLQKIQETLEVYPTVKGIQLLDADGRYLAGSAGDWITDSPAARQRLRSILGSWPTNSGSNPAPGIIRALQDLSRPQQKASVYVFGDEFAGRGTNALLALIRRYNPKGSDGEPPMRIHGVGFPQALGAQSGQSFANMMRQVANENGGTFVGLPRS